MPSIERNSVKLSHFNQDGLHVSTEDSENVNINDGNIVRSTSLLNCKAAKFKATDDNLSQESKVYEIEENVNERNDDSVKRDKQIPDNAPTESDSHSTVELALPEKIEVLPQQNGCLKTQSKFFSNFVIPDKGFWTPEFISDSRTVDHLVQNYAEFKLRIKTAYANADNKIFFNGYSEYHIQRYLLETLIGENNIKGSTSLDELQKYIDEPDNSKTSLKINNLKNSVFTLFPDIFKFLNCESKINLENFTPKFIQDLHKQVMGNGLLDEPGAYRKYWASPSQENWTYLVPQKIAINLDLLCRELREELEESETDSDEDAIVRRVKIVANFLTHFLQIHPFVNGNGRVARLLISFLMTDLTVVPVSLLATNNLRNVYLDCLRDARHFVPTNLARFIFESITRTIQNICISLDI